MALNFNEVVAKAKEIEAGGKRAVVSATISTLQTDGISMWAKGQLDYEPGGSKGLLFAFPSLRSNGFALICYFSNRRGSNSPTAPGSIGSDEQPFFAKATSKLRLTVTPTSFRLPSAGNGPTAQLKFEDDSTKSFSINLAATGDLLTGIGPAIANDARVDHAVYSFGFEVFTDNPPH